MLKGLHLFSFKTPTKWAELSEQKCTGCAFSMRNGVKRTFVFFKEKRNSPKSYLR